MEIQVKLVNLTQINLQEVILINKVISNHGHVCGGDPRL